MPQHNHICKNPSCGKSYYACNDSNKYNSWRDACCCPECYQIYVKLVLDERSKDLLNKVDEVTIDDTPIILDEEKSQANSTSVVTTDKPKPKKKL